MENHKPLVVVIGLGQAGMIHARALSKQRSVRLGLASRRDDVLSKAGKELCADALYHSYDAALKDESVTAVVVATPPESHTSLLIDAARMGKMILCEKPLGRDGRSIKEALAVISECKVTLMTGFMRRWDRAYQSARLRIADGAIGDVTVIKCASGDASLPGKYRREAPANALWLDLGVHDIDLARWLTSSEVVRVYALSDAPVYPDLLERGDGDLGLAILEMASGAKVLLHQSFAFSYGYNVTTEVVGKQGTLRVGDLGHVDIDILSNGLSGRPIDPDYGARFEDAFEKQMEAFANLVVAPDSRSVQSIFETNDSYANGYDGLRATVVAEALIESCTTRMPVDVCYDIGS